MRMTLPALITALLMTTASASALAATQLTDTTDHTVIGTVSVSQAGTLDEVVAGLAKKADEAGAPFFKITSAGGKNYPRGTAELLK